MSTTIDERVVEMRFDNQHFEKNVSTSMSTLDKLKQKLNLTGASKGLENIDSAAKKVNMSGLSTAVDTVGARFSAMEVMGVTALANLTNSAVNAGKRIVSALTIDPVKTGFQEYETQINAVQTILANTESKGSTIDDVNEALEQLNKYADKTIYNFTEMTRNIGTFTAAGVDLDTSVNAIQGIANLAAVSGSTSQQASTAMYQLSQALASGTVKLMDWNSVVNAGMGGEVFQNALKETARVHGVAIDSMIESEGSFRETLKDGWLTADILTETLQKFTLTTEGLTEEQIQANREMLRAKGYTEDQINEIFKLGNTATDAATKVKTFTQLWDVMKESAQSGWSQTWKILIGDFEDAKALLTPLADLMTGFIGKMSDWRNNILSGAMTSPFESIVKKINEVTKATDVVTKATKTYAEVVDSVISGEWGTGQARWDKLTQAGYDWAHVQNLVNEKLGSSVRHATDYKETQEGVIETQAKTVEQLLTMSDAQLREIGLTKEEIQAFRDLQKICEKTGVSLEEALGDPDLLSGRTLLINSFKNAAEALGNVLGILKQSWQDAFPPVSVEKRAEQLYNAIAAVHKFSTKLEMTKDTADKLRRTFDGLIALIDIITTITSGSLKVAFNIVKSVLSYFNLDILDITASVGDAIVKFRDWIDSILDFDKAIEKIAPFLEDIVGSIKDWFKGMKDTDDIGTYIVEGIISGLQNGARLVWDGIVEVATAIYEGFCDFFQIKSPSRLMMTIGGFLVSGLIIGILSAIPGVGETIAELCSNIFGSFEELDLSKVSAVFWTLSSFFTNLPIFNVISALANMFSVFKDAVGDGIVGIGKGASKVGNAIGNGFSNAWTFIQESSGKFEESLTNIWEIIKTIFGKIVDFVKGIDFGSLFAAAIGVGTLIVFKDLADSLEVLAGPLSSIGDFFDGLGDSVERVSKALSKDLKAKAMLNMAKAIGILAVSVFLLASLDPGQLLKAGGVILGLAVIIGGLTLIVGKWGPKETIEIGKFSLVLLGIASSLLIMTIALKQIASLGEPEIKRGYNAVLGLGLIIAGLMLATRLVTPRDITGIGGILLTMSATMLIMVYLMKTISELTPDQIDNGIKTVATFGGLIAGLLFITKLSKKGGVKGLGATLLTMTASLVLMIFVAKLAASMNERDLFKGALVISAFGLIIAGLIAATRLAGGNDLKKVGSTILAMSLSIALLGLVAKALGGVDTATLIKGGAAITLLGGMVVGLVAATRLAGGNDLKGVSTTILAMSIAIGILGGIAVLLGWIPLEHLAKGIIAVGILSAMMALMTHSLKGANNIKGTLITMTVAIGLLVVALAALTFIDPQKLAVASASISAVMGMFALLIQSTKNSKNTKQMVRTLLTLVGVVAALGLIIAGLSYITNVDTAIQTSSALAILLTAFSTSLVILGKTGRISTTATKNLAPMLGVTLGLAAILAAMSFIPNPNACIPTAIALGILLNALSASLVVLSMTKGVSATSVGVAALMALVVGELGLMLFMMKELDVNPSIETALALSTLLLAMSAACLILVPVGALASQAVMGAAALAAVILIIGGLVAALGGLSKIDGFNEVIQDGGDTLALIGQAIGKFVGGIVGGVAVGITSALPEIGNHLSEFMDNASGFIEGVKGIDSNMLKNVGALTGAILALTAADVITGLTSFLSGGISFGSLGADLSDFMSYAAGFIEGAKNIDPSVAEAAKTISETILLLTGANVLDGLASWLTGGTSLSDFGAQLPMLGAGLNSFVTSIGTFDGSRLATVKCAVEAIKAMAEAADSLPGEGGWVQKLLGEQSLASFGAQLPILGACLNAFALTIGTFDEAKVATIGCAANAVKVLAEAADKIPNEGGWAAKLLGDNSIATFGAHLPALGTNLAAFVANLGTFTEEQVTTIKCAGNAIKALAQASTNIDGQSEWAKKIFGDNGLSAFGDEMASLGKSLASFVKNLGTFTETQVATVSSAVRAIKALTGLANADLKGAQKNLPEFSEALPELASGIKTFINDMPATESVTSAVTNINKILDMVDKFAEANTSAAIEFKNSLRTLGQDGVQAFVNAFTSASAKHDVNQAGIELISEVVKGMESKASVVKLTGENLADEAIDGLGDLYDDGETAGKDLGSGLVGGIQAKEDAAYKAGYALGQAAVQGEKDGQASNSPSKLTMLAGRWLGEGLVIGIEKMGKSVYSAGSDLGKSATKSISSAISRITDVIDSDMDVQPTITPVLDLSNVRSGAGTIAGLFDMNPSMGVLANVGAISSTMNRIQNGSSNDDVVSAINKLRKDLGGVRGDTYSINGITYDDGSNIADAVKTLTRAVKVGRRV